MRSLPASYHILKRLMAAQFESERNDDGYLSSCHEQGSKTRPTLDDGRAFRCPTKAGSSHSHSWLTPDYRLNTGIRGDPKSSHVRSEQWRRSLRIGGRYRAVGCGSQDLA